MAACREHPIGGRINMSINRIVRRGSIALSLSLLAVGGSLTRDAAACGGEWGPALFEPDHRPRVIPLAEKALEEGRTVAAAGYVIRAMPHIRSLDPTRAPIVERAQRVLALALAQHSGALPIQLEVPGYARGTWEGRETEQRATNLHWAVGSLEKMMEGNEEDAALETDLAFVMAKLPERRAEARTRLERLAARDLIASAEGYATLAELRAASGDRDGQKLALVRCLAMAKAKDLCAATSGESAS
jgi:hypothetical protein